MRLDAKISYLSHLKQVGPNLKTDPENLNVVWDFLFNFSTNYRHQHGRGAGYMTLIIDHIICQKNLTRIKKTVMKEKEKKTMKEAVIFATFLKVGKTRKKN
jgi:hypothetical protein